MIDVYEEFKKHGGQFREFQHIKDPPSNRLDLCALIMLDKLVPGNRDMIVYASHGVMVLDVTMEDLANVATSNHILYLSRCGVFCRPNTGKLVMLL